MAEITDAHPVPGESLDGDAKEVCQRLWTEYRSFAANRENEAEELLDRLNAELEDLVGTGAGATTGAIGLRRFLDEVARQQSPDAEAAPRGV